MIAQLADKDGGSQSSVTFVFTNQGHTLGNSLMYIISFDADVDFCAYTVPHPSENKMHFRIQMKQGKAIDALKRGLEDLQKVWEHVLTVFDKEVAQFTANQSSSE